VLRSALCALSLFVASHASATPLFYQLDQNCVGSGCTSGPYGTVELDQTDATDVLVTVTLEPGNFFTDNGNHSTLAFSITGDPAILVTGFNNSEFHFDGGPAPDPPFGMNFNYGIGKDNSNDHCCSVLSFSVALSSNANLSINDFVATNGFFFASDIFVGSANNGSGATFAVAANDPCTDCGGGTTQEVTPEPWSFVLTGTGLLAFLLYRKFVRV
jgi:hypothetical protein